MRRLRLYYEKANVSFSAAALSSGLLTTSAFSQLFNQFRFDRIGNGYIIFCPWKILLFIGPHWLFTLMMFLLMIAYGEKLCVVQCIVSVYFVSVAPRMGWYFNVAGIIGSGTALTSFITCFLMNPGIVNSKIASVVFLPVKTVDNLQESQVAVEANAYSDFYSSNSDEDDEVMPSLSPPYSVTFPSLSLVEGDILSAASIQRTTEGFSLIAQPNATEPSVVMSLPNEKYAYDQRQILQPTPLQRQSGLLRAIDYARTPIVTHSDVTNRHYFCDICDIVSPSHVQHCHECNLCIDGLDHHCPWISKCVGSKNQFAFYTWVLSSLITIFYMGVTASLHASVSVVATG